MGFQESEEKVGLSDSALELFCVEGLKEGMRGRRQISVSSPRISMIFIQKLGELVSLQGSEKTTGLSISVPELFSFLSRMGIEV